MANYDYVTESQMGAFVTKLNNTLGGKMDAEGVRDTVAAFIKPGNNITVTHDDTNDTFTISSTASGGTGTTDPEIVRDTIAAFLKAGNNISVVNDDANDTFTISSSISASTVDYAAGYTGGGSTGTSGSGVTDPEIVRDTIAAFIKAGNNITVANDDANDTFTISSSINASTVDFASSYTGSGSTGTSGSGVTDPEVVRDTIASFIKAGNSNISIVHDDANDTLTFTTVDTNTTDQEVVRDTVASFLKAGNSNISIVHDDAADTLTLTTVDTNTTDQEVVRDTVAAFIKAGTGISVVHNDAADTFTITATATGTGGTASTVDLAGMITN